MSHAESIALIDALTRNFTSTEVQKVTLGVQVSHAESIVLIDALARNYTPELKRLDAQVAQRLD
jgi:hypothetical protein